MVSLTKSGERTSDICSLVGCIATRSKCGDTSCERNASIVEIGASSNPERSISKSPERCILGSKIPLSPFATGAERVSASLVLILDFNSAAAFLVNVMATISFGNNPGQLFKSVRSLAGALSAPWPSRGSLGPFGNNIVARCSAEIKC